MCRKNPAAARNPSALHPAPGGDGGGDNGGDAPAPQSLSLQPLPHRPYPQVPAPQHTTAGTVLAGWRSRRRPPTPRCLAPDTSPFLHAEDGSLPPGPLSTSPPLSQCRHRKCWCWHCPGLLHHALGPAAASPTKGLHSAPATTSASLLAHPPAHSALPTHVPAGQWPQWPLPVCPSVCPCIWEVLGTRPISLTLTWCQKWTGACQNPSLAL